MSDNTQNKKSTNSTLKEYWLKALNNENFTLLVILIVVIAVLWVNTGGLLLSATNVRNVLLQTAVVGVVAVGQAFVILSAGIDLSVGGTTVMVSCLGAGLMTSWPGYYGNLPPGVGLILMVLTGAAIGAINGLSVSRLRMPPLIVTLAIWQLTRGAAYQFTKEGETIRGLPDALAFFGRGDIGGVPVPAIIFILTVVVGYLVLCHTKFGRSVYAVGGSEVSAWLSGIKTKNVRLWVYIISGICAGVGGIVVLSRLMGSNVAVVYGLELDSIAAVVIGGISIFGGKGSIIGVLIGVFILSIVSNGMNLMELNTYLQMLIKGVIIIAAVASNIWRSR